MAVDLLALAPLPDFLLQPLQDAYRCHDFCRAPDKAGLLNKLGPRIRAVVGQGGTHYDEALLRQLPNLEIIAVFGVGYDGVPLDYCRQKGIRVTNTPDVLTDDVADIAVALVLMTSRDLVRASRFLHDGSWQQGQFPLTSALKGKTAGIVGLGRIGKAIAQRLEAFGMRIAYHGRALQAVPYRYVASLTDMACAADFLIVACPGGEATRHLINMDVLLSLGHEGILINIARGSIVDQPALIRALQDRVIKAAGLDVYDNEPHVPQELIQLGNVVLLPHVGSGTIETRQAMARLCIDNLAAHFSGRPLITEVK